jgi:hypothetical protein
MGKKRPPCWVLVGTSEGRRPLERTSVDGRIILKWIFEKWDGDIDWIDLARVWGRWPAVVNAVMNLRVT